MRLTLKHILILIGVLSFGVFLIVSKGESPFWNAVAIGCLMVFFWLTDALPLYATALLPIAVGIPLGVINAEQIASSYSNKFVFLFLGGFMLALAMEKWNVHKQIARMIIGLVGTSKTMVLLGFILSTGLLSMWISNTATALMMLPMATAVISNLTDDDSSKFPRFLLLSIAYSASIGGMATLVGSPPNSGMAGILEKIYKIDISFFDWMKFGLPISLVLMAVLFFYFVFQLRNEKTSDRIHINLEKQPWDKSQKRVIFIFLLVVLAWSFRTLIVKYTGVKFDDENVAIIGAILMFIIPGQTGEPLLEWKDTSKLAWGILLLFGGGFALASMLETNGVINEIAILFQTFGEMNLFWVLLIVVFISVFATEFMSNTAMVNVFVPIIAIFAVSMDVPVTTLCIPVALSASCAFMLPVGTPPNAIVFSSGQLTIGQMARTGFVLNMICVVLITLFGYFFIV